VLKLSLSPRFQCLPGQTDCAASHASTSPSDLPAMPTASQDVRSPQHVLLDSLNSLNKGSSAIERSLDKALSRLTDASVSRLQDDFYSVLDEEVDRLTGEFGDRFEVEAAKDMGIDLARRAKSVPQMLRLKFDPDIDSLIDTLEQMPSTTQPLSRNSQSRDRGISIRGETMFQCREREIEDRECERKEEERERSGE
jgi:hypothetical protein